MAERLAQLAQAQGTGIILGVLTLVALVSSGGTKAASFDEVKKLVASGAEAGDKFGVSVAVSEDTAVVGAYFEDAGGALAGAAYVFQRDQGGTDNWAEVKKLTASDAQADDHFGVSVAISGNTAVVGAYFEDAGGQLAGAVYVFQRDQGGVNNWGEVRKLTASDAQAFDLFGSSVAVSGDTIVVGALGEDAGGEDAGAAYVFQRDQGGADNWGEVAKLAAADAEADDLFGRSVAISDDTAVVGAQHESAGGFRAGAAYLYQRDEGGADNWGEAKKLTASDAQAFDVFGYSVAISGDAAVAGAYAESAGGSFAGAAYVFQRDEGGGDNWGEVKKLTASDAQVNDVFGQAVAVSGNTTVVGAIGDDAEVDEAGAAYVFQRNEGGADNWGEAQKLTASDAQPSDNFGASLAISANTAIVGAPDGDAQSVDAGAAYIFDVPPMQSDPGDTDLDGCSDMEENGPAPSAGGLRNYKNFWDFYDIDTENGAAAGTHLQGAISLGNIFEVANRFGQAGDSGIDPLSDASGAGYHTRYDRGPQIGANIWNRGPADGAVALGDVFAIAGQFAHGCL